MRFEWFAGVAPVEDAKLAVAALVVNSNHWKIKGSYVGKEAFSAYFGYPQSSPPVYAKARGKKKGRKVAGRKTRRKASRAAKGSGKKAPAAKRSTKPRQRTGSLPSRFTYPLPRSFPKASFRG